MLAVLSPIPENKPRPTMTCAEVVARTYAEVDHEVFDWARRNVAPDIASLHVGVLVAAAIAEVGFDAYKIAQHLQRTSEWPCDMALVRILDRMSLAHGFAFRLVLTEWVVATGVRFPAQEGDSITWHVRGRKRTGMVHVISYNSASALVLPYIGTAVGDPVRILAEDVTANQSRGREAVLSIGRQ